MSLLEGRPLLHRLCQRHRRSEGLCPGKAEDQEDADAPGVYLETVVEVAEAVRWQMVPGNALQLVLQTHRPRHPQRLDGVPGEASHVKVCQFAL